MHSDAFFISLGYGENKPLYLKIIDWKLFGCDYTNALQRDDVINSSTSGNHRLESVGLDAVKGRYWGGSFFFYLGE